MASFVEQATLKVNDQASKQIRQINRALKDLQKTARQFSGKGATFRVDTRQAQSAIRGLNTAINRIPRNRVVNVTVNERTRRTGGGTGGGGGGAAVGAGGRRFARGGGAGAGPAAAFGALTSGRVPTAVSIATAYITATGALNVSRAALTAGLESQAQQTRAGIIFSQTPELMKLYREVADRALAQSERLSRTRVEQIALDAITGGARGDFARTVVPRIAELEGQAQLIAPNRAEELSLLSNKLLNLANTTEDLDRAMALAESVFRAQIAVGESFNASTSIAALRTSGFANTITAEGLVGLQLLIDSLGQRAGSSLQRLRKELFTPLAQAGAGAGIAKGAVRNLTAQGFRPEGGLNSADAAAFLRDPAAYVQTVLAGQLQKLGVDLEDRTEVERVLRRSGFADTSVRAIADLISARTETELQRRLVGGIQFGDESEAQAANDLNAALKNLKAGFDTFSSQVLQPLFQRLAPGVNSVAKFLESVGSTATKMDDLAATVGGIVGTLAVLKGGSALVGLLNPFTANTTATSLNTAALNANTAALGGGALPGKGRKGGPGRKPTLLAAGVPTALAAGSVAALDASMNTPQGKDLTSALYDVAAMLRETVRESTATRAINSIPFKPLTGVPGDLTAPATLTPQEKRDADAYRALTAPSTIDRMLSGMDVAAQQASTDISSAFDGGLGALQGAAPGIGQQIGSAAAAAFNAQARVTVPVQPTQAAPNTGPINVTNQ